MKVWSCGGGTQSVAIAALIVTGRIAKPDHAVIVDTGFEKATTWDYMDAVLAPALESVGVNLRRVFASDYSTVGVFGGKDGKTILIPAFTTLNGGIGKLPNFCSYEWKRRVVERYMRFIGVTDYESLIGFSADEARRVAKSISSKRPQKYPLIELGITRDQCLALVDKMGWPSPPRSSCYMCPNQSPKEWAITKTSKDWAAVVEFDKWIRETDTDVWLSSSAIPIEHEDFVSGTGDLFGCESGECFT